VLLPKSTCPVMLRRLLLRPTGRTYATPHPRHGPRRTTCYRSNSVPSQDNRTAHHQGIHPGIGAPGPQSPILFVPRTASRAILRVLLTDSTCLVTALSLTTPAVASNFFCAHWSNRTHFTVGARIASVPGASVHLRHPNLLSPSHSSVWCCPPVISSIINDHDEFFRSPLAGRRVA
jgi:hypothetical protein